MKICLNCGHKCGAIPVLADDINDESVDLELISDCCYTDFGEISEDRFEALMDVYRLNDQAMFAELDEVDRLIIEAFDDEI